MAVIAVAEMFGISGRRDELAAVLERFEPWGRGTSTVSWAVRANSPSTPPTWPSDR